MKAVLSGFVAALFVAGLAAFVLESTVQITSEAQFQTSGARPRSSTPGAGLRRAREPAADLRRRSGQRRE